MTKGHVHHWKPHIIKAGVTVLWGCACGAQSNDDPSKPERPMWEEYDELKDGQGLYAVGAVVRSGIGKFFEKRSAWGWQRLYDYPPKADDPESESWDD